MSLRLWFPFSKDDPTYNMGSHSRSIALYYTIIENIAGIDFPAITQENVTIDASGGKISAKCANFTSGSCIKVPAGGLNDSILFKDMKVYNSFIPMFWPERKNFSIAFWMKSDNSGTMCFFCGRRETGKGISLFKIGSTFRFDAGEQTTFSCASTYPNWTHFCFTWDGKVKRFYINGIENSDSPKACTANVTHYAPTIRIGNSASNTSDDNPAVTNQFTGKMNDYRFYDHCLSPKEVKLLAQGLVAHYKLDGLKLTNLVPQDSSFESESWGGVATTNSQSYMGNKSLYLKRGTTVAHEANFPKPIVGHKYYGREMIKTNGDVTATDCRFEIFGGDGPGKNWVFGSNIGNYPDWTINSNIITIDSVASESYGIRTFVVNSSNDVFIDSMIVIDLTADFGAGNEPSKAWCDANIPYFISTITLPNDQDCSGYNNHGTSSTQFRYSSDSKRYKTSSIFENNKYINCGRGAMVTDALTVNWWGKMSDWSLYSSTPMRALSCTEGGGWNFEPNSGKMCFAMGTGSTSNSYKNAVGTTTFDSMADNSWHMFTGTYDGFATRIYVDGELETINTAYSSKIPIFYNASNSIFIGAEAGGSGTSPSTERFTGKISDVRIYATALSAAAVKELYQSSISFLDNGTLQCSEIVESPTNLKYNQNGITQAELISEVGYTNKMKIKTLPDGSAWARIHWLDVSADPSNKALYFANEDEVAYCVDKSNRFSLMGLVDHFYRSRYILTNLMPSLLESNYTGGIYDTTMLNENQKSFKVIGGSGNECYLRTAKQNIQFKSGHVYYSCAEIYQTQPNGSSDFYFIEDEPNWYAGKTVSAANTWTRISSVFSSTKWGDRTTGIRLDYNNLGQSIPMWFSKMMLIDLTEDFGKGNEPSCEWCDKNIQYFSSWESIEIYDENNKGDYEFMLTYPKISNTGYNRWFQNSSANSSYVGGFFDYDSSWPQHHYGLRKHYSGASIYDCSYEGYWYAPIGQLSPWDAATSRAIPAANESSTTETELWIRIDNLSTLQKISLLDKSIQAHQIYEL